MHWGENLSEIVRTLLIMTATGSMVAIMMFLLQPLIKKYLSKSVQYYIWVLVLISFVVPFSSVVSLPFAMPLSQLQEVVAQQVKTTAERREELSQERYGITYEALEAEKQIEIAFREIGLVNGKLNDDILFAILAIGVVSFLIDIGQYAIYVVRLARQRRSAEENESALLNSLCKSKKCPRLHRNAFAPTPMLMGVLRPVIYLPDRAYSDSQLKNILRHELTHWRRHDVVIKWVMAIATYVHWFNPIVHLLHREIDRACELACDEAVINDLDSAGKQSYGDTLIDMATDMKKSRVIISTTMCEEKKTLKARLLAIMQNKKTSKKAMVFSFGLLVFLICGIIILGASAPFGTASDALFQRFENESPVISPQRVIKEVEADDHGTVIFYYNMNGNLGCSIVERNLLGYHVVKTGAELTVESAVPVSAMSGQYADANKWRVWGILREPSIENALIYGQNVTIVEADDLRFFYIIGDGRIPDGSGLFYNDAGELVWEIPSI